MARSVEGSSRSSASVEEVWAVWADPGGWLGGPVEAAELHGTFAVGSTYTTKLKGWAPATATISRIEPPRLWTSVVGRRLLTVTVEHVVEPAGDETLLTERWDREWAARPGCRAGAGPAHTVDPGCRNGAPRAHAEAWAPTSAA
jgi:Polyketide cyclase / dehydrase and lipid transport